MSFSPSGLNDALAGVTNIGLFLSLHTADPGTTGASEDIGVVRVAANWLAESAGTVDSSQVEFTIPVDTVTRTYTHFGVWDLQDDAATAPAPVYKTGGPLDASETFSTNGGTLRLTATLTATDNTA